MPTIPYKEETTLGPGKGHVDPPRGRDCAWLKARSMGNSITYEQACRNHEVVYIRTEMNTDVVAAAGGGCDLEITTVVTTIHTGQKCEPPPFEPVSHGEAYTRFVKLSAQIAEREKAEKEKKDKAGQK